MHDPSAPHLISGCEAELLAQQYLTQQGLRLVQANYQCKLGEIDLIMRDQDYYVFVEVRFRKRSSHGDGAESVGPYKQQKLIRAAERYLQQKRITDKYPCRFDVVAIGSEQKNKKIEWIKDAFWVEW